MGESFCVQRAGDLTTKELVVMRRMPLCELGKMIPFLLAAALFALERLKVMTSSITSSGPLAINIISLAWDLTKNVETQWSTKTS